MSMPAESTSTGIALCRLFPDIDVPAVAVTGIAADSRRIEPGFLFLAAAGRTHHGLLFAAEAVRRGAAALAFDPVGDTKSVIDATVPVFAVPGLSEALGDVANRFYQNPSRELDVYGVTGTNGKTTTAFRGSAQCLSTVAGKDVRLRRYARLAGIDELDVRSRGMTTPPCGRVCTERSPIFGTMPVPVTRPLSKCPRTRSIRIAWTECVFDSAVFTNLTRDHLSTITADMQRVRTTPKRGCSPISNAEHRVDQSTSTSDFGPEARREGVAATDVITTSIRMDRVASCDGAVRPFVQLASWQRRQRFSRYRS